jgi:CHAD domain-containing protein
MAYKFGTDEPVASAIVRNGREQLDRAVRELSEGLGDDPTNAIHDARKAIKKERSLLRLACGAMAPQQRRRENAALREAGRRLSGARDADVMISSIETLSERFAGQLPATTFDAIREHLEARRAAEQDRAGGSLLDNRAVQDLGSVRVRVDDWQITKDGWEAIESGLVRSYKRGRKAFARARKSGSLEDMHAWRKRVKDLWYHARLLAPAAGPAVRGQAKDAHRLADLLGDEHDLGVLRDTLTREVVPVPVDIDAVVKLLDHRREELRAEAIRLGRRVYAESPKAFRRRLRRSWEAGRAVAHVPYEQHPAETAAATREPHSG